MRARGDAVLGALLESSEVVAHPLIVGELACGSLRPRSEMVRLLNELPTATTASHDEVMHFITAHRLSGQRIGSVDAHLLASAAIDGILRWTRDKALGAASAQHGLGFNP